MRQILQKVNHFLTLFGIDLRKMAASTRDLPTFLQSLRSMKRQETSSSDSFEWGGLHVCLGEGHTDRGQARGHYFHQDLLVARRIYLRAPEEHMDVGSRIDGFVAHVATFRPIRILDIRPLESAIPNVSVVQADLSAAIDERLHESCDSLSCLHALEHFGLGRYGDPIDYDGHVHGLDNLHRILKPGGTLYVSVPIGPQRLEFNAHRVFSLAYLLDMVSGRFRIERFSYVDDSGDLHEDVPITPQDSASNFGCIYGCGIFEMTKLPESPIGQGHLR